MPGKSTAWASRPTSQTEASRPPAAGFFSSKCLTIVLTSAAGRDKRQIMLTNFNTNAASQARVVTIGTSAYQAGLDAARAEFRDLEPLFPTRQAALAQAVRSVDHVVDLASFRAFRAGWRDGLAEHGVEL